jgi:hypothetical protein
MTQRYAQLNHIVFNLSQPVVKNIILLPLSSKKYATYFVILPYILF